MAISFDFLLNENDFVKSAKNCEKAVNNVSSAADKANDAFKDMIKQAAALGGVSLGVAGLKEFVSKVFEVRSYFQDINSSMVAFLGNEQKANEFTEKLKDYAWYNMFEFSDLASASQQMIAYGVAVDDVIPTLDKLSDIAVATKADLGELVAMYNKARSTGYVDSQATQSWATHGLVIKDALKDMGEAASGSTFTFEQLEKVLSHVTEEGGLFYQQQKKMMDNLSSSWGQLQDNMDSAFNEIGESLQEPMKEGIDFLGELVDNYKAIGAAVADMIALYGSYRVALAATTAMKKINIAIDSESTLVMALAKAEQIALTEAEAREVAVTNLLTAAKKKYIAVAKSAAAATLFNPYVLAAAAITAMVFGIYKLVTAKSAEEKAIDNVNDALERQKEQYKEDTDAITKYVEVVKDTEAPLAEQAEAMNNLLKIFPDMTREQLAMVVSSNKQKDAIKMLNEEYANMQRNANKAKLELSSINFEMLEATQNGENEMKVNKAYFELFGDYGYSMSYKEKLATIKQMNKELAIQVQKDGVAGLNEKQVRNSIDSVERLSKKMREAGEAAGSFTDINGVKATYKTREELEQYRSYLQTRLNELTKSQEIERTQDKKYWYQKQKEAKEHIEGMTSEQIDAIKNGTATKELKNEYDKWVKAYEDATKQLKKFEVGDKSLKSASDKARKRQDEIELIKKNSLAVQRAEEDAILQEEQNRINLMRQSSERTLAQRALDHNKQLLMIERNEEDTIRSAYEAAKAEFEKDDANKYSVFTQEDAEKNANYKKAVEVAHNVAQMATNAEMAQYNNVDDIMSQFMLYEDELSAEIDKFDANIKRLEEARQSYIEQGLQDKVDKLTGLIEYLKVLQASAGVNKTSREYEKAYGTYNTKRNAIEGEYSEQIALAEAKGDAMLAKKLQKDMERALSTLDIDELGETLQWEHLFKDAPNKFSSVMAEKRKQIIKSITGDETSSQLDIVSTLFANGDTNGANSALTQYLDEVKDKCGKAEFGIVKLGNTFKQFRAARQLSVMAENAKSPEEARAYAEASEAMAEEAFASIASASTIIGSNLCQAAEWMKEIAQATNDADLDQTADKLSSLGQNLQAAGQGAASGGWIGAIVGGVTDLISQVVSATASIKAQEIAVNNYYENFKNKLKLISLDVKDEDFETIFGTQALSKAKQAMQNATEALRQFNKEQGKLSSMNVLTKDYTGISSWFHDDVYTNIKTLAPELWGSDGVFSVEKAKAFLETCTMLSEQQKNQIQYVIDLSEAAKEAEQAVDEYLSSMVSNLASNMTDAIFDSIRNGSNAWYVFEKAGAEVIDNLGKQMINELYVQEYLNQFTDSFKQAFGSNNPTEVLAKVMGEIYNGLPEVLSVAQEAAQLWDNLAEENGFDLSNLDSSSASGTSGVASSFSQDSIDEANGRMASLQMGQQEMITQGGYIKASIESILSSGEETRIAISDLRDLAAIRNSYLSDIYTRLGLMYNKMGGLDEIANNTSNI